MQSVAPNNLQDANLLINKLKTAYINAITSPGSEHMKNTNNAVNSDSNVSNKNEL